MFQDKLSLVKKFRLSSNEASELVAKVGRMHMSESEYIIDI